MKRRGTNRRQVLDLDTSSSSPKRSWQTKYQQIYMDHLNNTTAAEAAPVVAQNGSDSSESRLPQLVGYTSDSEGDEPKKPTGDIDSKVQDFLKEISDIVPSVTANPDVTSIEDESSRDSVKKSKTKSKKVIGPSLPGTLDPSQPSPSESAIQQPTIAWQECYDENSGCFYFWNVETNEVTWEMPEALRAYHVALEQWNAQQLLLAQQAAGGVAPGYSHASSQQPQKKQSSNKTSEKSKNKRSKPAESDSEDEKIELITSYGPNSDDDDSDSSASHHSSKKKKVESSKSSKKERKKEKEIAIGPQLPPGYIVPEEVEEEKEEKPVMSVVPPSKPEKTDSVLKGTEIKKKKEKKEIWIKVKSKPADDRDESDVLIKDSSTTEQDVSKLNALQRLKNLKNKESDESSTEDNDSNSVPKLEKTTKTNTGNEGNEGDDEEEEDVEDSILERLKNQAKILKELGGEIPDEIKELIETNSDSEKDKAGTPPNEKEETQGKEVEKELKKEIKSEGIWPEEENTNTVEELTNNAIVDAEIITDTKIVETPSEIIEVIVKDVKQVKKSPLAPAVFNEAIKKPAEKAPTSFSLIAGYGNEDDSDPEEDRTEEKSKVNGKRAPLFPIVPVADESSKVEEEVKVEKASVKNANVKVIKLSAKAKELIHSSTTTEKARATEFVVTAEGLKHASAVVIKETQSQTSEPSSFPEPVKKVSRKKRLEVPVIRKQQKEPLVNTESSSKDTPSDKKQDFTLIDTRQNVSGESEEKETPKPSSTPYTTTWAYNSELKGGEYRGFGYGRDFESEQKPNAAKKGMIQFVKADTLMPKTEAVVNIPEKKLPVEGSKQEGENIDSIKEQTKELAQVITEKVKFLCEGKEAVPPVQVMAIQLETLTSAHSAGGLSAQYLRQWLTSLDGQLAALERAAAPQGWLCQWDRSFKRYFYRNEATGSIQWEYPAAVPAPVKEPPPPQAPAQGGEEAMELCDSPPPQPPATPPPPRISISRTPSPGLPEVPAPPLPPLPPPPPVISEQPPLPPLPSETPPPPPLPPSPPPPPPPPIISIAPGEPLPPGVDMPEDMFEGPRPPLPAAPPPPPKTPPPPPPPPEISGESVDQPVYGMGYDAMHYDSYQMQPVTADYTGYPYTAAASGGGDSYVIARPPASNPVPPPDTSLATELDSFYNEVAALEPPQPPPEPSPSPPPPPPPASPPPPPQPQPQPTTGADPNSGKKKKKTKLTPGLALKKKGVSSLVAKWQQVQQDVRREAASEDAQS